MERIFKTIGLLRFSVLTPTYYSERFPTLKETAAHIFSDERMDLRFRIFENLCLPTLINQTDPDFEMIVLTAESMPPVHLERLLDLIEPLPNIHCRPVGTDNHYKLLQNGYNSISRDGITHRILFRLDDDDAVDLNFVKRTKRFAKGLAKFQSPRQPYVIAHNRGFYVNTTDGAPEIFDAVERAPLSTGTTLVAPAKHGHNPYRFNHRKLPQHYNTYQDISVPAFIRTIHGDNKSNPAQMGLTHKLGMDEIADQVQTHFGMTLDDLRAL
ncbi:glycosyltransferase [Phaeobacter marinintestinus]|uniref:glycosyltransferase n=1 Tax=Falsiphaeobacter marinintestinus TaxID=1492905 RepID=UPI0011B5C83A|nr:glycosyltransferase [Phaeobacter marinintestinus]